MKQFYSAGFFIFATALLFNGCAQKYTRHLSETYKENKIGPVTFAVMAMPSLEYKPPSSCFSNESEKDADAEKYRKEWEIQLIKTLSSAFPKQKFLSLNAKGLDEIGISSPTFFAAAEEDIEKMGVTQYEAQGGEEKPVDIRPSQKDSQMRIWGQKLKEKDSVDFIIALVHPKMTGEVHSTGGQMMPMAGGGMMMTGGSTSTSYTSDARFGIWSVETGELAYASGSITASSGFCIFMGPQTASINDNTSDMATQLKALVTAFLNRLPAQRVELGRAEPAPPLSDRLR